MRLFRPNPRVVHGHMWMIGVLGLAAGLALMIYVPSIKAISASVLMFSAFHLIGAVVALSSIYATLGKRFRCQARNEDLIAFGWTPAWTLGPLVAAMVFAAIAVAVQAAAPNWWPLSLVSTMLACSSFAGYLFTLSASKPSHAVLPWVDLGLSAGDRVLDGGCGAGRTTIALAQALPGLEIIALDRFDAEYIDGGGRQLIEHNLQLSGLQEAVSIVSGDLTNLPFPDASFDGAVSAHAMDHLGSAKALGLSEACRVLKPGGRFLLMVWVRGWTMFAVANVLSFGLWTPSRWAALARCAGFEVQQEGRFNGLWFFVLQKP